MTHTFWYAKCISKRGVIFMYVKKSIVSGIITFLGIIVLCILSILYCFTELNIPEVFYFLAWGLCISFMVGSVSRIERQI